MRLKSLTYSQFKDDPREWSLTDLLLDDINLVVGKNAVGKSKTLSVIYGLSLLLSRSTKLAFREGCYDALFDNDNQEIRYSLEYHDSKVIREEFSRSGDSEPLLKRWTGGIGEIYLAKDKRKIDFQTPEDEIAVVARRDSIQHGFLEPLYKWANSALFYHFGSSLGKDVVLLGIGPLSIPPADLRDENAVLAIYQAAWTAFGEDFDVEVRNDMRTIGYELEEVWVRELIGVRIPLQASPGGAKAIIGLAVKERDLRSATEHTDISQGMFRALSLIVQLNYALRSNLPSLILIDDIGEGLDYERSCSLINLLMSKVKEKNVQLVMSTNDRFVMNSVPLEKWTVLQRINGNVHIFNYHNSKKEFDDFKFSGLNNFDFFAYDYLSDQTAEEGANVETGDLR